jgi:uncharacterized protein YbaR (Trm112 family)
MAQIIHLKDREATRPQAICPHCKQNLKVDIDPYKENIAKIMESKCPYCKGTIFTGLLLLAHPNFEGLLGCIKIVVEALDPANKLLIKG